MPDNEPNENDPSAPVSHNETSEKILANLAQVEGVITDMRETVHRIQRDTPFPVPIRFRVYGSVPFPVDMLRYDNCVPYEAADSLAIEASYNPDVGLTFVTLRKISVGDPSYERWTKMGWKVET